MRARLHSKGTPSSHRVGPPRRSRKRRDPRGGHPFGGGYGTVPLGSQPWGLSVRTSSDLLPSEVLRTRVCLSLVWGATLSSFRGSTRGRETSTPPPRDSGWSRFERRNSRFGVRYPMPGPRSTQVGSSHVDAECNAGPTSRPRSCFRLRPSYPWTDRDEPCSVS